MFDSDTDGGCAVMSKSEPAPQGKKPKKWGNLRVKAGLAEKVKDIADATGVPIWKVVERLMETELPTTWQSLQPKIKKVRAQTAGTKATQEEGRAEAGLAD
jgi:hypothetical protein